MKHRLILPLFLTCLSCTQFTASAQTIDQLLEEVRQGRAAEKIENAERERRFKKNKDQQDIIINELRSELAKEESRSESLRLEYEKNHLQIETQKQQLQQSTGSMGEFHNVTRQIARDFKSVVDTSLISAEKTGRSDTLEKLADSGEMPSIDDLHSLWQLFLEDMVASGKVSRFKTKVITASGEEVDKDVTRIGTFNASADGQFLRFIPETGRLAEPRRQPPYRFQKLALALEKARENNNTGELHPMVLDPTRGSMLSLLVQQPNLIERIRQGGIIGYIIIALGIIALLIALERFFVLFRVGRKVNQQMQSVDPNDNNPLGRIMSTYAKNPGVDAETLGLKLDESILRELPAIKRGLRTLGILAAIAPLLGLLGTVIGIIDTFQSITLYGTGDPRLMSGGISQALVTTVLGLITAIPILLMHSILSGRSNNLVQIMDEKSAAMVAALAEKLGVAK